jgi:hypothetical protein
MRLDMRKLNGLIVWALLDNTAACDFYWRRGGRPIDNASPGSAAILRRSPSPGGDRPRGDPPVIHLVIRTRGTRDACSNRSKRR